MRHEPPIRWAIVSGLALGFAFAAPSSPSAHQLSPPHAVLDHAMAGVRADRLRVPPTSARVAPDPVRGSRFARTPAPISPHSTPAPLAGPCSGTPGSSAIQSGRGDSRVRRRQPDSRVTVEASRRGQPLRRGSHAGYHGLQVAAGDAAWVLTASALVLMMTLPGLALFYGGLVRAKNVLNILMQCVLSAGIVGVLWILVGYSLAFGTGNALIGDFSKVGMAGVTLES